MNTVITAPPPNFGIILACPNLKIRNALIQVVGEVGGVWPLTKSGSVSAQRARYAPMPFNMIINTPGPHMEQILGHHSVVYVIVAENRVVAAHQAQEIFTRAGFSANVHTHAEPEFPDGFLVFVSVEALAGIAILIWPRPQDVTPVLIPELSSFPKHEPWTAADLAT